jgi:NADH-quinone oxidoreductase subunit G
MAGARIGVLAEGGNSAGAWLAGALPHRGPGGTEVAEGGQDWRGMFNAGLKGYVLLGVEPERDCAEPTAARAALSEAECVVALSAFADDSLYALADVLLPIALFPETSGSYVNAEGRWQSVSGCTEAPGEARPAWKILRVLGNLFDLDGFDYMGSDEIAEELQAACKELNAAQPFNESLPKGLPGADEGIVRLADVPLYAVDGMVRRSAALQQTAAANTPVLSLHPATAERLGLGEGAQVRVEQGGAQVNLPLTLDARVAEGCALIPAALAETGALGCGTVSLAQA